MSRDIRLDVDFLGNMKTRKLIRELGDHGAVCMIRLWSYVALRHPKGLMNGMTTDDLEDASGWTGERGVFSAYALRMRWVDQGDDGHLSIHDWSTHQRWVFRSEDRSEAAKAAVDARWEKYRNQTLNTERIRPVFGENTECNTPLLSFPITKSKDSVTRKRFTIPTIEEIKEWCEARRNTVDPIKFHAHYTANGWKVGKNPMKNWKAAIVTWEKN